MIRDFAPQPLAVFLYPWICLLFPQTWAKFWRLRRPGAKRFCSAGAQVRQEPRRETRGWMSQGLNHIQSCLVCPASISSIISHCQKVPQKSPNPGERCRFPSPCEDFGRETSPHFLTSPSFSFPWQCKKKHTLVCPDFAKKGVCPKGARCKLLHPQKKRQPRGDSADPPSKCQWLCEETGR